MGNDEQGEPRYTTDAKDQEEVAKLQARIAQTNSSTRSGKSYGDGDAQTSAWMEIPSVSIADGAHKYVLISATEPAPRNPGGECLKRNFVVSKRGAAYHRNAAEPMVDTLERVGFRDIRVTGGGRIYLDEENKKISIFGFSYGFGRADHALSKSVIEADGRHQDYEVTWSEGGY